MYGQTAQITDHGSLAEEASTKLRRKSTSRRRSSSPVLWSITTLARLVSVLWAHPGAPRLHSQH